VNSGLAWLVGLALCLPALPSRRLLLDRAPWLERGLARLGRLPLPAPPRFVRVRVSWRWVTGAVAAAVLLAGGVLACLWRLGTPTWGGDEPVYALAGHDYLRGDYSYNPEHPPLVKYLIGLAQHVFGDTVTGNRVPSALALLAAGVLAWRWLRRVGPPGAGPVAAVAIWTLPVLGAFPEVMAPQTLAPDREAMLEPVAAVLALGALAAGWWWARSGRWVAVPVSGVLAGLAVAAKLPALFVVGVAGLAGCVGAALRRPSPRRARRPSRTGWGTARWGPGRWGPGRWGPGRWGTGRWGTAPRWVAPVGRELRRVGRTAGQGLLWLLAGAAGFAACYAPMGWDGAVANFRRGWDFQTWHGEIGHPVLVHGAVTNHAPWWVLLDWQSASWGGPLVVVAVACLVGGLVSRPLLVGYLTAAWAVPATLLVPLTGLALPHYPLLWRPTLVAAVAVGGCATVRALWRDGRRRANRLGLAAVAAAAALALAAAVPAGLVAGRSAYRLATLHPTSYAALPTAVTEPGAVWMIGDIRAVRYYLPGRPVVVYALPRPRPLSGHPAAVILDRDATIRLGDWGAADWAAAHGYRLHRDDRLDIWVPGTAARAGTSPVPPATFGTARGAGQAPPPPAGALLGRTKSRPGKRRL
jgi:Dolichyl-phosphate-mannose-protein mannosyltransferase